MTTQYIPMPLDEFRRLPPDYRWKREYIDGEAIIRPRDICVSVSRTLRDIHEPDALPDEIIATPFTPPQADERVAWGAAYRAAFEDTPHFCDYDEELWESEASRWLNHYIAHCLPESIVLRATPDEQSVIGTALLRRTTNGVSLESLMVAPLWQRRGLATRMLRLAADALRRIGETVLYSGYHPLNTPSEAWHLKQGFTEIPSYLLTEMRLREARSWKQMVEDGEQSEQASGRSLAEWDKEITRLETLRTQLLAHAERNGFRSVEPAFWLYGD